MEQPKIESAFNLKVADIGGASQAPSADAKGWGIAVGGPPNRVTFIPEGHGSGTMPMLPTDEQIDMVLYVDQTTVEVYINGGRYALTDSFRSSLYVGYLL
jgi:hypothetical protein